MAMNKETESEIRIGSGLEVLVLASIITAPGNAYGATIHEGVEELVSRAVTPGAIFTTLKRLEAKGLVTSFLGSKTNKRGGRAKRFYKVDKVSRRALREALQPMRKALLIVG